MTFVVVFPARFGDGKLTVARRARGHFVMSSEICIYFIEWNPEHKNYL